MNFIIITYEIKKYIFIYLFISKKYFIKFKNTTIKYDKILCLKTQMSDFI